MGRAKKFTPKSMSTVAQSSTSLLQASPTTPLPHVAASSASSPTTAAPHAAAPIAATPHPISGYATRSRVSISEKGKNTAPPSSETNLSDDEIIELYEHSIDFPQNLFLSEHTYMFYENKLKGKSVDFGRSVDPQLFVGTPVFDWIKNMGWENLLYISEEVNSDYVLMFMENLSISRDVLNKPILRSFLNDHKIELSVEKLNLMLEFENSGANFFVSKEWPDKTLFDLNNARTLFWDGKKHDTKLDGGHAYNSLTVYHKIMHKIIVECVLYRGFGKHSMDMSYISTSFLYLAVSSSKINLGYLIFEYLAHVANVSFMLRSIPYRMVLTRIFKKLGIEEPRDPISANINTTITLTSLSRMGFHVDDNGEWMIGKKKDMREKEKQVKPTTSGNKRGRNIIDEIESEYITGAMFINSISQLGATIITRLTTEIARSHNIINERLNEIEHRISNIEHAICEELIKTAGHPHDTTPAADDDVNITRANSDGNYVATEEDGMSESSGLDDEGGEFSIDATLFSCLCFFLFYAPKLL